MSWYQKTKKEVYDRLSSTAKGLTTKEVIRRQQQYGKNSTVERKQQTYVQILLDQFNSFLPWIFIGIGLLAFAADLFLGMEDNFFDAIIIFFILISNSLLAAYQEYRSQLQVKKIEHLHKATCQVLRDEKEITLFVEELVPGDIIILAKGAKVPADAYLVEANDLELDEALLTGESLPVIKKAGQIKKEVSLDQQYNIVFRNTFVINGEATAIVIATGEASEVGKMALHAETKRKSSFIKEIDDATNKITMIALALILFAILLFMAQGMPWSTLILMSAALLIGAIPEALPAIVTFSIASSAHKLAKKGVLAKKRVLIETLGSIDTLCVDKTGTLTTNKLSVNKLYFNGVLTNYKKLSPLLQEHLARACLLPNSAKTSTQGFIGDDIDIAFIDYFNEQGFDLIQYYKDNIRLDLQAFSFHTKSMSAKIKKGTKVYNYTKGAPEHLFENCNKILHNNKVIVLTKKRKKLLEDQVKKFSRQSLRPIGLAYEQGKDMVFIGLIGLFDPPKEGLKELIEKIRHAGIAIKIITGDHKETALSIARTCGLKSVKAIDWEQLKDLSTEKLKQVIEENDVFTRMSPENKLLIVKVLQENNHRVAITGDGVNDVPALQEAEVGIAIGERSADMAKDAADLIITDDHLEHIVQGIREGRTIFQNIKKVINYLLTANLGEIMMVIIGSFFGIMPFLPIQLIWVNFAANYAPALALSVDKPGKNIMSMKPTGTAESFITKYLSTLAIAISVKKVILLSALFYGVFYFTNNLALAQTVAFTWLVLWHFVRVITIKMEEHMSLLRNPFLIASLLVPLLLQLIILYTPLQLFFRVVPLSLHMWGILVSTMIVGIFLEQLIELFIKHHVKHVSFQSVN